MERPDVEQARAYALARLAHDLDPALCYHSLSHTRDDVAPAVERLAAKAGVAGEDLLLLRTAAYFHDIGFLERRDGHEEAGTRIAALVLPRFGYSSGQIVRIGGMIMATRLPQAPSGLLEQLLADGDLDLLGRSDFLAKNRLLRAELAAFGHAPGDAAWLGGQIDFLRAHHYWTDAARELRAAGKRRSIATLEALLAACGTL
jgi:uncharacterized protein